MTTDLDFSRKGEYRITQAMIVQVGTEQVKLFGQFLLNKLREEPNMEMTVFEDLATRDHVFQWQPLPSKT